MILTAKKRQALLLNRVTVVHLAFILLAVVLGAGQAMGGVINESMNPDGISYLDMGDAFFRGEWNALVNLYWSPLYALLLGFTQAVFRPTMEQQFPLVQWTNYAIYLAALACFIFFWRAWVIERSGPDALEPARDARPLPRWLLWAIGYALFLYASLALIKVWSVTPDMLMAGSVFLAAGLIGRINTQANKPGHFILLGVVIAFGYLAKAPMFPLGLLLLAAAALAASGRKSRVVGSSLAVASFLLIAGPYLAALSSQAGHLTFGDSGRLNYARFVNGLPDVHWQGSPTSGQPAHPTRLVMASPPIYEFAHPIAGTYAPWYDPAYWFEGVQLSVDPAQQVRVLIGNVSFYLTLLAEEQAGVIACFLLLLVLTVSAGVAPWRDRAGWGLVLVALAAFGMYALVYVETRYMGPFVVFLWAAVLANVRIPAHPLANRLAMWAGGLIIFFLILNVVVFHVNQLEMQTWGQRPAPAGEDVPAPEKLAHVSAALYELGIKPGDRVAVIGYGFNSYWARLAGVKIVAEMYDWEAGPFYRGDSRLQSEVFRTFQQAGAIAIVAEHVPAYAPMQAWHRVGESSYYIYLLEDAQFTE